MKPPVIWNTSTDEEFAEYAAYVNSIAEGCNILEKAGTGTDPWTTIGRLRAATRYLAATMASAIEWRKSQRAEIQELAKKQSHSRRAHRNRH